jgi:pimeloyl-ACP methyl ester carboxylesterase
LLRGKCLFICGEADPMGDPQKAKEKFEKYGVHYRMFSDVGHGINHEISSEVNQVMLDYMRNYYHKGYPTEL